MELTTNIAFRSRFNIVRHVVQASTPSFSLASNVYKPLLNNSVAEASNKRDIPPIVFAHANGFHKETWEPLISRLNPRWVPGDLYAFDCRNQGDSAILNKDVLEDTFDWYSYAHDILKIVDTFKLKKPIGIGHSFGASSFVLAELERPGTFSAIIAIDPTMFPKMIYINAPLDDHPMAQLTLKRRDFWKSRMEAKAMFLERRFFRAWHPEALDIYVEHGMLDVVDKDGSQGITLKCPKFQEAVTFACVGTGLYDSFERLNELNIPIHLIFGENSEVNPTELAKMKLAQCKFGSMDIVKDTGHLLNLEKPQETADLISAFLESQFGTPMARL
ncbi:hypothetical protein BX616_001434 [Lobosporangium transversale]|uniref:Alpha/Beta hydrolase protein n=1 Tax=Lobosporangium transversale TaxID=64571 RepID=A0A1Y2GF39_9FUNG|nr:Alpha/Beta hydrolase protein [Lobosporangium transversale]KAF9903996.1 hypothetical protein BX616_001434 [Lobosporangium transversale]ORZ09089.1 Alpha/Beta hydrolase protein [Lobosporangium transversale]|eukprot:XP_021878716.1 Alpha/Beta hydrolase protein [Lobosporangium transversale]